MTEIEKLNERITQLTELVKTGSEAIKSMESALKAAEEERDRLADQRREQEPKFERNFGGMYYYICNNGAMEVVGSDDVHDIVACNQFICNNYFKTEKRAQEVADKINFLLKLERLHDIYCPNCESGRYYISYNTESRRYCYGCIMNVPTMYPTSVMFPSEEIALKVCNILNKELEKKT